MRALVGALSIAVMTLTFPLVAQQDQDVDRAFAAIRQLATSGDVVAQFSLGETLYYGSNDTLQAIEWLRKAAAQRYAPAEFHLGQLYDFGFGVTPSDRDALTWYQRAAEHGHAAAQRTVGDFYRKGRAVPANDAEAASWYRRAAGADDLRAQYQLGEMYFAGTGVPRDYPSAYLWLSLAASQAPLLDNRKGLQERRDIAAARMTPAEVHAAARRVAVWKPS